MPTPIAVDGLDIQIIVDNVTDNLSSTPAFVETETAALSRRRRGAWVLDGDCLCCAAHGLSCLVTLRRGDETRTVLFDSGPEDRVFEQNVSRLGIDIAPVEAIVLSHGHWDHAGGMLRALQMIRDRNGGKTVAYYAHPEMFRSRAARLADGAIRPMKDVPSIAALEANGASVVSSREPQALIDGLAVVSGEIARVTPYETGLPGQVRRTLDGTGWEPDELLMDERSLAFNVAGKGLVVLSACSHAGIVNVLTHARKMMPDVPLYAALGGLHLSGTNERIIPETVEALRGFGLTVLGAGHCTGWRAMTALANAFGDKVLAPLAVGKRFRF
ncbi:MAG TPA: MBL fold metallo-hydrolase [Hyphomicrobiaceae bacterium]|nr:MBL fold metallo-hydrolase [Hyphomicrobiaceae bacterium]